jgi:hypothetical protein
MPSVSSGSMPSVKSIQSGMTTMGASGDITIAEVDLSKSELVYSFGVTGGGTDLKAVFTRLRLSSTTTIEVIRKYAHINSQIEWQVIEYN